jgi:nucleoside-diphosphate-sugar epimerase
MKILVTGSKGFVGKETCKLLEKNGHEVIHFDLVDGLDIRDYATLNLKVFMKSPDRILHLAAIARFSEADDDPKLAFETNVKGTENVAKVASMYRIPVVYASTGSVYMPISEEPPITESFKTAGNSVYGCTKLLGEKYIEASEGYWIILRYSHLYGKDKRYHGLIGGFLSRIERALDPILYGGKQSNDFCYVKDVAMANMLALEAKPDSWRQHYNIGTGEELTAEEAGAMIIVANNKAKGHNKYTGKVERREQRTVDSQRFVFDISKAKNMLGFEYKYNFLAGLKDMFK